MQDMTESEAPVLFALKSVFAGWYDDQAAHPTMDGRTAFVSFLIDWLRQPGTMSRAWNAAIECSGPEYELDTHLQHRVYDLLLEVYPQTGRSHVSKTVAEARADAFAKPVASELTADIEDAAWLKVKRIQFLSDAEERRQHWRERDAEMARNRPRPPRRKLYPC